MAAQTLTTVACDDAGVERVERLSNGFHD
jgi:hypothetical protein